MPAGFQSDDNVMSLHVLEKLQRTNPRCEIWWDSSPLLYEHWAAGMVREAPSAQKDLRRRQLRRLFDPHHPESMLFRGVTTNPPLNHRVIREQPGEWAAYVREMIRAHPGLSVDEAFRLMYKEIIRRGAAMILPLWHESNHRYGYICGQLDPRLAFDYDRMLEQALEIAALAPNVLVKCPGSREGYRLIEELTARGIGTNNTTSFCVPQYLACMEAVSRGLARARANRVDPGRWRSVITHMSDRFGSLGHLHEQARDCGLQLTESDIRWAEVAIFKRAYHWGRRHNHPSKMLMCSMRMGPELGDGYQATWHMEKVAGADIVFTCPPAYIRRLMHAEDRLREFNPSAIDEPVPEEVLAKLMKLPYFVQSYEYDGMSEEEFGRYASFVGTASEFSHAIEAMIDFTARQFEASGRPRVKHPRPSVP